MLSTPTKHFNNMLINQISAIAKLNEFRHNNQARPERLGSGLNERGLGVRQVLRKNCSWDLAQHQPLPRSTRCVDGTSRGSIVIKTVTHEGYINCWV